MRKNILKAVLVSVVSGLTFGVASAEVVLSGRLIGSMENIRASGNNIRGDGSTIYRNRTRFNDESSFVRISGNEELGAGVQAGFQIESGFDVSGGNASGDNYTTVNSGNSTRGFGTRNTGLFFQGGFGKILFGRWEVFYDNIYLIEPDRKSLPNKISLLGLVNTPTGGRSSADVNVGDRYNNVLSYYTPSLYGLKLQLSYVPTNESSTLDMTYNGRIYAGTLVYKPDYFPLTVLASGFRQRAETTATAQQPGLTSTGYSLTAWRFGAVAKIPLADTVSLHIGALYQLSKVAGNTIAFTAGQLTTNVNTYKRSSWGIPLAFSVGSNTLYATYGRNSNLRQSYGGDKTLSDTSASFYMMGYNYDISKRTALGVYYAKINNKSLAGYDFYGSGNGLGGSGYSLLQPNPNGGDPAGGISPSALGLSFRHLF